MAAKKNTFIVDIVPIFKVGDAAPEGYVEWHEWARVQLKAGIRQKRCRCHGLWLFPNETCANKPATLEVRQYE